MLGIICDHIHNYFAGEADIHPGAYVIEDGAIDLSGFLAEGQYFRIVGSALNDGVYCYPAEDLTDERFTGEIWAMRVPAALKALAEEITAWQAAHGDAAAGVFQSESFGGYSYTKAAGLDRGGAGGSGWMNVFRARLNPWRKIA